MSTRFKDKVSDVWRGSRQSFEDITAKSDYAAMTEYLRLGRSPERPQPASLKSTLGMLARYSYLFEDRRRRASQGRLIEIGAVRCAIEDEINMKLVDGDGYRLVSGSTIKMHLTGSSLHPRQILADLGNIQSAIGQLETDLPAQMTGVTHRDLATQAARALDAELYQVADGIAPLTQEAMLTCADAARIVSGRPPSDDRNVYMVIKSTEDFLTMDLTRYRRSGAS